MESDFVIRQHIDSVVPSNDPGLSELLNNYKFPPANPQPASAPTPMAGYPQQFGGNTSNNGLFLGAMLGQMQANMQNQNQTQKDNGFQLNINTDVLRWLIVLLLVATLIWVILKVSRKEKSPLKRRLRKLERSYRKLQKAKRKNPKALEDSENEPDDDDDEDDGYEDGYSFDDYDDDDGDYDD